MSFLVDLGVKLVVGILGNAEARGAIVKAGGELYKEIKAQNTVEEGKADVALNDRLGDSLTAYLGDGRMPDPKN